ncbi:MAG: hypothetical protein FWE22_06655 [Firmicutes bacterium]|nr:hypothetical protein [Bacillota bacterium]
MGNKKTLNIFGKVSFIMGLLSVIYLAVVGIAVIILFANPSWLRPANAHCCEMTPIGNFIIVFLWISAIISFIPFLMSVTGIVLGSLQVKRLKTKLGVSGLILSCMIPLAGILAIIGFVLISYFIWLAVR